MAEEYLTVSQVRERLGISREKLRKLIDSGDLPIVTSKLDQRLKLVPLAAVKKLEAEPHAQRKGESEASE